MSTSSAPTTIDELRTQIYGTVHARGEDGYAEQVLGFNLVAPLRPDLVVAVAEETDVEAAVRFAARSGMQVSVMSTGHGSYQPVDDGLLIRTTGLDHVHVDKKAGLVRIGAGAVWSTVVPHFAEHGFAAVTGSSPGVGAVGLVLGGGFGPLSRTFGAASDYATSFRVVTAAGDVVVADAKHEPDLFWALKGGKVGLGVVTEVTLQLLDLPVVYGGGLFFDAPDAENVLRKWVDWTKTVPEAVNSSVNLLRLPPLEVFPPEIRGKTVLHLRFAYVDMAATGEKLAELGEEWLAPLRALAPVLLDHVGLLPTTELGSIHRDPADPLPVWERGVLLAEIDQDCLTGLLSVVGVEQDAPFITVEIRHLGGALAREPQPGVESAVGGRRAPYSLFTIGIPDPDLFVEIAPRAAETAISAITPWVFPETTYHWAGHPHGLEFDRLWSAQVGTRLRAVRERYDPHHLFAFGKVPS